MSAHGTPIEPGAEVSAKAAAGEKPQLKLGRYEVVRELGKGAMGIVYLAKDPLIGRLVALKTIRAAMHADDDEAKEFQQRFIREAQAAGILNHPSIVTVHDIGQDDASGVSFIAMEFVEGQNLKEVLSSGRALTFEEIAGIIAQVADALDFAHSKGIVHRDVKPANVILVDGLRAKITDFGIAKIASGAANLTTTGQFLGTPNYMAPEQVKGAPVDGRTDIFAAGICLYECLTRRKPFGGDSLTSISYKIVHEPFPPLHDINPQVPAGFEEVVAHCLAKDPIKRYQRARDLAAALRAIIRGDKPQRPMDPVLAEETMVTRDRERTVEVPFPEAMDLTPPPAINTLSAAPAVPSATLEASGVPPAILPPPAVLPPPATAPGKAPRPKGPPMKDQLRRTLSNVRALPLWRRRIPPSLFVAAVAFFVAVFLAGIVAVRAQLPEEAVVDLAAEAKHAKERTLRLEGEALVRQGRVTDAYAKYQELQKLAPRSPHVAGVLQKLDAIRQREEVSKQQLAQAELLFQQGLTRFNEKDYPEAIELFQQSFSLNPSAPQPAEYLKLAQEELQKQAAARRTEQTRPTGGRTPPPQTATATATTATDEVVSDVAEDPVRFNTVFIHPFTDGNMIVRVGADVVASEPLFTDRPARFLRRASREPRPINVSREFPPKIADVQVWVTVPALGLTERATIPGVRFASGATHRLVVRYDQASKRFTYELN